MTILYSDGNTSVYYCFLISLYSFFYSWEKSWFWGNIKTVLCAKSDDKILGMTRWDSFKLQFIKFVHQVCPPLSLGGGNKTMIIHLAYQIQITNKDTITFDIHTTNSPMAAVLCSFSLHEGNSWLFLSGGGWNLISFSAVGATGIGNSCRSLKHEGKRRRKWWWSDSLLLYYHYDK